MGKPPDVITHAGAEESAENGRRGPQAMDDDGSQYRLRYCNDSLGSVLNRRGIRAFIVRNKPYDGQELADQTLIRMLHTA